MGYELYREVRDNAPSDWTATERLVAWAIADNANDKTRRSWIKVADLMGQTGITTERGLRKVLQRLADHGYEFRMPIGEGRDGRTMFATRGHSLDFLVPRMPARVIHIGGTDGPPIDSPEAEPEDRLTPGKEERADRLTDLKGEPPFLPSPHRPSISSEDQKMVSSPRSASGRARRETNGAAQPRGVASRQARASGTSVRVLTSQDKIDGTRFAIAAIYGESWNRTISDEEALALFEMKAPARKRVTNVTAYMTKIFEDTPAFDTLLSQLDTELDHPGDDYDQARDVQPFPLCPRCGGTRAEIDPARGVCALCARELIVNGGGEAAGWNVSIIQAVRTALFVTTGKTMDDDWCTRVAGHILTDDKGRARKFSQAGAGPKVKYITTTISTDDKPERFLPTPIPGRVA